MTVLTRWDKNYSACSCYTRGISIFSSPHIERGTKPTCTRLHHLRSGVQLTSSENRCVTSEITAGARISARKSTDFRDFNCKYLEQHSPTLYGLDNCSALKNSRVPGALNTTSLSLPARKLFLRARNCALSLNSARAIPTNEQDFAISSLASLPAPSRTARRSRKRN